MELSGKQKRHLRSLGNQLKPKVYIGVNGVSEAVIESVENAFNTEELIKLKLQEGFLGEKHTAAEETAEQVDGTLVQILGNTILLYRAFEEDPLIQLP